MINQTISQSVSENIVLGTRSIAKLYLGAIIESARKIQLEWMDKTGEKQTDLPTPPPEVIISPADNRTIAEFPAPATNGTDDQSSAPVANGRDREGAEGADEPAVEEQNNTKIPSKAKQEVPGPLRPEHLREAVRRHRLAFEAGGVGLTQTWYIQQQAGVERFPQRTGGRRIFY